MNACCRAVAATVESLRDGVFTHDTRSDSISETSLTLGVSVVLLLSIKSEWFLVVFPQIL